MRDFHQALSSGHSDPCRLGLVGLHAILRPLPTVSLLAVSLILVAAYWSTAQADSVAKELRGYRSLEIKLDDDAADCALDTRDKELRTYAVAAMEKLDLIERPDAQVDASLIVANIGFGALNVQCALHVELSFQTSIPAQNITGVNDETRAILDRLGVLPVKVWSRNAFGVAAQTGLNKEEAFEKAYMKVTDMTDLLVDLLREERL